MPPLNIPGFVLASVSLDLMHIGDLGIAQVLLGNIAYEIFRHLGGTLKTLGLPLGNC